MEIHDVCCFCNGNSENAFHLFVLCPFVSSVRRASIAVTFKGTASSFKDWWNQLLCSHDAKQSEVVAMII